VPPGSVELLVALDYGDLRETFVREGKPLARRAVDQQRGEERGP